MKLLLDENLSRRLVPALQERFPGSSQVALLGLEQADDLAFWQHVRQHDFVLVFQAPVILDELRRAPTPH